MPSSRLHLIKSELPMLTPELPEHELPEHAAATTSAKIPAPESYELQRLRAERDSALEELAFLHERLRSTEAYYAHRFELEHARAHAEHQGFLEELSRMSAEFHRRSRRDEAVPDDAHAEPAEAAGAAILPRTR